MLLNNCFHTDENSHDHIPYSSSGFPYVCIHTNLNQHTARSVPWHWHTSMEIVNVVEGEIELRTQNRSCLLRAGDAAFVNTSVLHAYRIHETPTAQSYAHLFHTDFLSGADNSIFEEKYFLPVSRCTSLQSWVIHPDTLKRVEMIRAALCAVKLMQEEPAGYEFDIRTQLCLFWRGLLEETDDLLKTAPATNSADSERIKLMMDYIRDHYAESVSVDDIAASAGISSRECSRCFHRCIGTSPMEHLNQYRIRRAAKALRETSKSVLEISEECGFSSASYFSKVFRELAGQTPKQYQMLSRMSE